MSSLHQQWRGRTITVAGVAWNGRCRDLGLKFFSSRRSEELGYWHCDVWELSPCRSKARFMDRVFLCEIDDKSRACDDEFVIEHHGEVWAGKFDKTFLTPIQKTQWCNVIKKSAKRIKNNRYEAIWENLAAFGQELRAIGALGKGLREESLSTRSHSYTNTNGFWARAEWNTRSHRYTIVLGQHKKSQMHKRPWAETAMCYFLKFWSAGACKMRAGPSGPKVLLIGYLSQKQVQTIFTKIVFHKNIKTISNYFH